MNSDSGRYITPLVWLICASGALIFLATVVALSWVHGVQSERRVQAEHRHSAVIQDVVSRSCAGLTTDRLVACVYDQVSDSEEARRAEQDLTAQQEMSRWALGTMAFGLAALIVSTAGLIALLNTVKQGQMALEHTQHFSYQQLRAYIYPGVFRIQRDEHGIVKVEVPLRNSGLTPCTKLRSWLWTELIKVEEVCTLPDVFQDTPVEFHAVGPHMDRLVLTSAIVDDDDWEDIVDGKIMFIARLCYTYKTYTGEQIQSPCFDMYADANLFNEQAMQVLMTASQLEDLPSGSRNPTDI